MSGKRDSNSRPRPWQGRALPTELLPHEIFLWKISCGDFLLRLGIVKVNFPSALGLQKNCLRAFGIFFSSLRAGLKHFQKICQSSMLSDESGAKVVVLGRLTKTISIFFGPTATFLFRDESVNVLLGGAAYLLGVHSKAFAVLNHNGAVYNDCIHIRCMRAVNQL